MHEKFLNRQPIPEDDLLIESVLPEALLANVATLLRYRAPECNIGIDFRCSPIFEGDEGAMICTEELFGKDKQKPCN